MQDSNLLRFINYASRGTKIKLALVFILATVIVTGSLLTLSSLWKIYKGPEKPVVLAPKEEHREIASTGHEEANKPHEIKGIVVGFMDKKDTHMAQAQFTLLFNCMDEACKKNLVLNHAKVLDTLFEVGSDFYVEDFQAAEASKGFARFKTKLTEQLTKKFSHLAPHGVAIHDWNMN